MKFQLIHKRSWGNDRFYPYCRLSKGILEVFKQNCLSLEQTRALKELGVKIKLLEEQPRL